MVSVAGEIDLATAPVLQDALDGVLTVYPTALIIDLSEVEFLGSAGLQILAATHDKLKDSTRLAVVADGPATSRPIQLTGLNEIFTLFSTLDEALAAMQTARRAAGRWRRAAPGDDQP